MIKKITLLVLAFIFLNIVTSVSQNTKLSVVSLSDKPDLEKEHVHKLQISNSSTKAKQYELHIDNIRCKKQQEVETILSYTLYDKNKNLLEKYITVPSKSNIVFYIKLTKPNNFKLDSWNCSEIQLQEISNTTQRKKSTSKKVIDRLLLKTFMPDTKNYR